jgi:carboxypeptidase family protein
LRKLLTCLFILIMAASLSAQVRTGNIYGSVVDSDGNALPGVTVTLTGSMTAAVTSITSAEGKFRFISLPAGSDYIIKAELEGFKTDLTENVIVTIGSNVDLTISMQMGALSEEVTVTAVTPVVDTKKTTVAQTVNRETLQSLPTARDPWVVMQQAPGRNPASSPPPWPRAADRTSGPWTGSPSPTTPPSLLPGTMTSTPSKR